MVSSSKKPGVLKNILKKSLLAYGIFFTGINGHIMYDHLMYNRSRIEHHEEPASLVVRRYSTTLDGEQKYFTLVGENHMYSQEDYELAKDLFADHSHFANEVGTHNVSSQSLSETMYDTSLALSLTPSLLYYMLGSGRRIGRAASDIAQRKGEPIHSLEPEGSFTHISFIGKTFLLGSGLFSLPLSPLAYYGGKHEVESSPDSFSDIPIYGEIITERDTIMAESIIDLLEKDDIDYLLAEVGLAHLPGVISNLEKQLPLEEIAIEN